jgi:hypothetical protein
VAVYSKAKRSFVINGYGVKVKLYPGNNYVSEKEYKELEKTEMFKEQVELGVFVVS